jgi:hypothetical protein
LSIAGGGAVVKPKTNSPAAFKLHLIIINPIMGSVEEEGGTIEAVLAYGSRAKIEVDRNWEEVYAAFLDAVTSKTLFNDDGFTGVSIIVDGQDVQVLEASKVVGYSIL